jgi:hypothetical protein
MRQEAGNKAGVIRAVEPVDGEPESKLIVELLPRGA